MVPPTPSGKTAQAEARGPWWRSRLAKNTALVFLGAAFFLWLVWFFAFRPFLSTDDARVAEDLIGIAPDRVGGTVIKTNVAEGDRVVVGQVLLEMDHAVYQSRLLKASAKAGLAAAEAARAQRLTQQGVMAAKDYQSAVAEAQSTQADLQLAQNDLDHTYLKSPVDGVVVRKTAVAGNLLEAGQVALVVADTDRAWISANLPETHVGEVRMGQKVRVHVDEGGDLTGHISEITAATASSFALLPSENASGNFIKLVQRVPIQVALDPHPDQVLKAGQSVEIRIRVR